MLPPDGNPETVAAEITSRPPVLLVHGERDELIPPQALFQSTQALAALGVPVEWHLSAGVGHGIDPEGFATAANSSRGIWRAEPNATTAAPS